ncbi:MAG TPA: DUF2442 domain-containing protein [Blastocatellia bacterium]|nr:DUF2442 domain-containing protein [Blastocatellia bacterium]
MAGIKAGKWTITEEEFERQFAEATKRGEEAMKTEIRAREARYDRKSNRLIIELMNGATHIVPCELIQGLRDADPKEISAVELGPRGASLHWEKLDQDFTVGGLVRGVFGTKKWMEQLKRGRRRVKSKARTTTARKSGRESAIKANNGGRKTPASSTGKRGRKAA